MRSERLGRYARELRANMTDAERKLWSSLRLRQIGGARFRRQHVIGAYIADFACVEQRLVIELDGGQHLESERDRIRDAFLEKAGWRVLRFWNDRVLKETESVLEAILVALGESPHPSPPPQAGEGTESSDAHIDSLPREAEGGPIRSSLPRETGESPIRSALPRETGEGQRGGAS